jgi:hypothetical protein
MEELVYKLKSEMITEKLQYFIGVLMGWILQFGLVCQFLDYLVVKK